MGNIEKKRERFKSQIAEIRRLSEEAAACAQLLSDQADSHQELLLDDSLTEEQLDALLADKPKAQFFTNGSFQVTEGLM